MLKLQRALGMILVSKWKFWRQWNPLIHKKEGSIAESYTWMWRMVFLEEKEWSRGAIQWQKTYRSFILCAFVLIILNHCWETSGTTVMILNCHPDLYFFKLLGTSDITNYFYSHVDLDLGSKWECWYKNKYAHLFKKFNEPITFKIITIAKTISNTVVYYLGMIWNCHNVLTLFQSLTIEIQTFMSFA